MVSCLFRVVPFTSTQFHLTAIRYALQLLLVSNCCRWTGMRLLAKRIVHVRATGERWCWWWWWWWRDDQTPLKWSDQHGQWTAAYVVRPNLYTPWRLVPAKRKTVTIKPFDPLHKQIEKKKLDLCVCANVLRQSTYVRSIHIQWMNSTV